MVKHSGYVESDQVFDLQLDVSLTELDKDLTDNKMCKLVHMVEHYVTDFGYDVVQVKAIFRMRLYATPVIFKSRILTFLNSQMDWLKICCPM